MKNLVVGLITSSLLLASSVAVSGDCEGIKRDKAEYLSSKTGEKLVEKFGGGSNIRVRMTSCEYNSYSDIFKTQVQIYWDGSLFSSNHYNIDGEVKMNADGSDVEFSQTYASDSVKSLSFWRGAIGGAILLGVIVASENGKD